MEDGSEDERGGKGFEWRGRRRWIENLQRQPLPVAAMVVEEEVISGEVKTSGDLISFRFKGSRVMWMSSSLPLGCYLSVSFFINFFPSHSLKEKKNCLLSKKYTSIY